MKVILEQIVKEKFLSAFAKVDIPLYQSGAASSKIREIRKQKFAEKELLKLESRKKEYNLIQLNLLMIIRNLKLMHIKNKLNLIRFI